MTKALLAPLVLAAALMAGPALAHSALSGSTPANGAAVVALDALELSFNETVQAGFATVTLTDVDGNEIELGEITVSDDAHSLVVPVEAELKPGDYLVQWALLSRDGHRVTGEFSFSVE